MNFKSVLKQARSEGRTLLNEVESKQLLAAAGVSVVRTELATTAEQATQLANDIGYPVVLKIVSADISHKSDAGGVKVGLGSDEEIAAAFIEIVANAKKAVPDAAITGIAVQGMAETGTEVIVGMTRDPQFGPVMMFGLGGVLVEVLKDVSFRVLPLTDRDVNQMVNDIKGRVILDGVRGMQPADKTAICDTIMKIARFVGDHPEIEELDLNPLFVYAQGIIAVDARIVVAAA